MSYRRYVTDMLQNIPQGKYLQQQWSYLVTPREDFDADQVIERVLSVVSDGGDNEPS